MAWRAAVPIFPPRAASDLGRAKRDKSHSIEGEAAMSTRMLKGPRDGDVGTALMTAEAGLTSGGAVIYQIQGVSTDVTSDHVVPARQKVRGKPKHKDHGVKWAELVA